MTTHKVYADCWPGGTKEHDGHWLCEEFKGTRAQCSTFIKNRARQGRPTHFLFTTSLPREAAEKRYLP